MFEVTKQLFSAICINLTDNCQQFEFEPSGVLYTHFIPMGKIQWEGRYNSMLTSIVDVQNILLTAKSFWYTAIKNDIFSMSSDVMGLILIENPFFKCQTIEEAQIKADVFNQKDLFSFRFLPDM